MKVRKDIIGLYVIHKGQIARPTLYHAINSMRTEFRAGDIVRRSTLENGTSDIIVKDDYRGEYWTILESIPIDIYRYAKQHYFKNDDEFNDFLMVWHSNISGVVSIYDTLVKSKSDFDKKMLRVKKIKSLYK